MPKLNAKVAKQVDASEAWSGDGNFMLPEGRYAAQLAKVEERQGREYPQWSWEFVNLHDVEGNSHPGRQWHNTSMSPKAFGGLKRTFEVFGYTTDTDTDEMIGEWATLVVIQEVATVGKRAGQRVNRVSAIAEFDPNEFDFDHTEVKLPETASAGGRASAYDTF